MENTPDFFTDPDVLTNSNIFTNREGNTLIKEFEGDLRDNPSIQNLDAVVGFLRASGYFSLRPFLDKVKKVRVLVGINADKHIVTAKKLSEELPIGLAESTKSDLLEQLKQDIECSGYKEEVENGILQMVEDLRSGKLELRAHPSKKIHAKIYILYPDNFSRYSGGIAITGSSNLSGNGLGISPRRQYEFNVKMPRFEDVNFSRKEFELLWAESEDCEITAEALKAKIDTTYLSNDVSPYELYVKTLIEYFAEQVVESVDNKKSLYFPPGYIKYQYQIDAVIEGYQKLLRYDGLFLADVVGLGKTIVATLIAEKFLMENGRENTKILVVYPPPVEQNWKKTFHDFGIDKHTKFITNGSLDKVLDEDNYDYWNAGEYDLILVDESHKFRNSATNWFKQLQDICKTPRSNHGSIGGRKKVILISATPMNNSIADIYTQICLFQDSRCCTIEGVSNLAAFFAPLIEDYKAIVKNDQPDGAEYRRLARKVRERVIKPITIRRTRTDIESIERYCKEVGGFPKVAPPIKNSYQLNERLALLFEDSMNILVKKLHYTRYKAIAYLKPEYQEDYAQADIRSYRLAGIHKNRLVKRLESSFRAFKTSINNFRTANKNMIELYEKGHVVFITPDLDINKLLKPNDDGEYSEEKIEEELKKIEDKLNERSKYNTQNREFSYDAFLPDFITMLREDQALLDKMCDDWGNVSSSEDPKFAKFQELLMHELFSKKINPEGKLVVFTESLDTAGYLKERIARDDLLVVSSKNRKELEKTICENFDANYKVKKNDFNIIVTTDVLAEGVNLHRSNVIVNYDTPWNPTKLMQRIGRVNRIGSNSKLIYNYVFYPSREGNREINLNEISLSKIQTFHSTFGEDNKIYSEEEIIERDFDRLFDEAVKQDNEDLNLELPYLEELRELYTNNLSEYKRIEKMSLRSRTGRKAKEVAGVTLRGDTLVFLKTNFRKLFFLVSDVARELSVLDALEYFKADRSEPSAKRISKHHEHVEAALKKFNDIQVEDAEDENDFRGDLSKKGQGVGSLMRLLKSFIGKLPKDSDLIQKFHKVIALVERGTSVRLNSSLKDVATRLKSKNKKTRITTDEGLEKLVDIVQRYASLHEEKPQDKVEETEAEIILSESFTQ